MDEYEFSKAFIENNKELYEEMEKEDPQKLLDALFKGAPLGW